MKVYVCKFVMIVHSPVSSSAYWKKIKPLTLIVWVLGRFKKSMDRTFYDLVPYAVHSKVFYKNAVNYYSLKFKKILKVILSQTERTIFNSAYLINLKESQIRYSSLKTKGLKLKQKFSEFKLFCFRRRYLITSFLNYVHYTNTKLMSEKKEYFMKEMNLF